MATAAQPDPRDAAPGSSTAWDGRARCRLCAGDGGADQEWCAVAAALVCDDCCDEVLGGEPEKLRAAGTSAAHSMAPLEILASCATCPRLGRKMAEDDADSIGPGRLH
jgi:hypothetical protein